MTTGLEVLLFDVDGTLADTEDFHRQAFNLAFADAGLDWSWDQSLYKSLLAVTGGEAVVAALDKVLKPRAILLRNDSPLRLVEGLGQEIEDIADRLSRLLATAPDHRAVRSGSAAIHDSRSCSSAPARRSSPSTTR